MRTTSTARQLRSDMGFETQGSPIQINNWVGPVDPGYNLQARFVCIDLIFVRVQIYSGLGSG